MATQVITDEELKDRLISALQKAGLEEDGAWDDIVSDSNLSATNDVISALVARGYTLAQITAWDAIKSFVIDQGLYWCLVKGAVTHAYDPTFILLLDRRKDLETVELMIGGVLVVLGGTARIASGQLKNDTDVFTMDMTW